MNDLVAPVVQCKSRHHAREAERHRTRAALQRGGLDLDPERAGAGNLINPGDRSRTLLLCCVPVVFSSHNNGTRLYHRHALDVLWALATED